MNSILKNCGKFTRIYNCPFQSASSQPLFNIMAGQQKKISSFFTKRTLAEKSENLKMNNDKTTTTAEQKNPEDSDEPVQKKSRLSSEVSKEIETINRIENNEEISEKLQVLKDNTFGQIVNIGPSWFTALEAELGKEYISTLCKFVMEQRKKSPVYPPVEQVFTWTTACPIDAVKVVIIGQDPYHGPKQAHGLSFSVLPGIKPPPSLQNMFKEMESSIDGFTHPGHGNLTGWAKQGVLLLNACLTVTGGAANSHSGRGWEKLTDAAIRWLNSNTQGVVFMLWGSYAQKKGAFIDKKKHHILKAVHPSPLSAHRGFFGCKHFSQCNELLEADGRKPIDWSHLPEEAH